MMIVWYNSYAQFDLLCHRIFYHFHFSRGTVQIRVILKG
jgi:hypothetical protein